MWGVPGVFNIPTWHREYHNHSDSSSNLSPQFHCISVQLTPVIIPNAGVPGVFLFLYIPTWHRIAWSHKAVRPVLWSSSIVDLSHNTEKEYVMGEAELSYTIHFFHYYERYPQKC